MKTNSKNWVLLDDFMSDTKVKIREIYSRINTRQWYDGYVIKKTPTGRIKWGCIEDYHKWGGLS